MMNESFGKLIFRVPRLQSLFFNITAVVDSLLTYLLGKAKRFLLNRCAVLKFSNILTQTNKPWYHA